MECDNHTDMPPLAVPREKAVRRCVAGSFSGCHDPRKNFFRAGSTFSGAGASNTVKNLIGGISHGIPSLYLPPREAPGTPRRRRPVRRRRRRRGIPSIFRFALLWAMPAVVLFVLHAALPAYLEQASAHGAEDENGTAAEAVPAEEGRIAAVEPVITPAPAGTGGASEQAYDFSAPVPESPAVEDSYFDDAVFIGDSRTEGLIINTGLSNATSYVYKGLMVDTVFTKPAVNQDGKKRSVMDAMKSTQFSKVYIMLGINETGWVYSQIFQSKYGDIIDGIREINPGAVIYIQGIIPVSSKVSSTHRYITNAKINEYNIDLESGRVITLRDWFGPDYRQIVAERIEAAIAGWSEKQRSLLWEDLSVIDLISEDTDFYLNQDGQIVVVFEKYEAACGAAGNLEFMIQPAES